MLQAIFSTLTALLMALAAVTPAQTKDQARPEAKPAANPARDSLIRIVEQIKRADYEGDRVALKRLHGELTPLPDNRMLASRGLYWRGFALWRRAINGFNESPSPKDLEEDLNNAIADFNDSLAHDPAFVEFENWRSLLFRLSGVPERERPRTHAGHDPKFKLLSERCHGVRSR